MNKKEFSFIQHDLIPRTLVIGNIAIIHLVYVLATGGDILTLSGIGASILLLTAGIFKQNKYALILGMVLYILILGLSF
jgi:hypothetical protein